MKLNKLLPLTSAVGLVAIATPLVSCSSNVEEPDDPVTIIAIDKAGNNLLTSEEFEIAKGGIYKFSFKWSDAKNVGLTEWIEGYSWTLRVANSDEDSHDRFIIDSKLSEFYINDKQTTKIGIFEEYHTGIYDTRVMQNVKIGLTENDVITGKIVINDILNSEGTVDFVDHAVFNITQY